MIMAGTAIAAMRLIPTGAPTNVPNCHRIFFLRLHGFLPQNVQPDGLHHMSTETTITTNYTISTPPWQKDSNKKTLIGQ